MFSGSFFAVLLMRLIVFRGSYWGTPIQGHYHMRVYRGYFYSSEMDDQMESPGVKWKLRLIGLYFGLGV